MSERIKISLPIVVEGKYDKSTLLSIFDTTVVTLGGFAVFNSKELHLRSAYRSLRIQGVQPRISLQYKALLQHGNVSCLRS